MRGAAGGRPDDPACYEGATAQYPLIAARPGGWREMLDQLVPQGLRSSAGRRWRYQKEVW